MARQVKITPDQMSEKWNRRTKNAIGDMVQGIQNVSESPAKKAVAKQDKMKANLMKSIDDGTWSKRLGSVTLDDWKTKTVQKVQERLPGGVDAAMPKRQKFDNWLHKELNTVLPKIDSMPDLTMEDSVNRVRALMEHMNKNKYKKS